MKHIHRTYATWIIIASLVVALQASIAKTQADEAASDGLHPQIRIYTTLGDMVVELDAVSAPKTVINFMDYVSKRYYDGLTFHRLLNGKLIQGGKYTPDMKARDNGLRPGINLEWTEDMKHKRGTMAMYHEFNVPNSTRAEFFINTRNNQSLADPRDYGGYVVFGHVIKGMDVADKISHMSVSTNPHYAAGFLPVVPVTPIMIKKIRLVGNFDREAAGRKLEALRQETERLRTEAIEARERAFGEAIARIEKSINATFTTTESGLQYAIMRKGYGGAPLSNDSIMYHFQVMHLNGSEIESTYRGEKAPHKQLHKLIKGLEEGVAMMSEGGMRMFIVPAELAFGNRGVPDRIAPGETVVIKFELFEILAPEE